MTCLWLAHDGSLLLALIARLLVIVLGTIRYNGSDQYYTILSGIAQYWLMLSQILLNIVMNISKYCWQIKYLLLILELANFVS